MSKRTVSIAASVNRTRLTPAAAAVHVALASALLVPGAALAQAAEKTTTLQEVKIIGTSERGYGVKSSTTATKTDTPLLDTPQAITVITKELMRDQAMQSMADAIRYVPGIVTAQGEGNRDAAVFRGNSSTSDFYIDGVRDDVQYYRDFYNIESVEALKGSNAMIFGRGGSGGVINRVSKLPQWNTIREASLTLGSWSNRRATVDVGQAVNGSVAFRVTGLVEDSDSYRDGVSIERKGINPTVAIRAGKNTSVVLGYEHFRDDRIADRGIPALGNRPVETDVSTFFGNAELSPTWARINAFTAVVDHDFGNGITLRNRSRYAEYDKFYQNVYANGAVSAGTNSFALGAYQDATQRNNLFNQTDVSMTVNVGGLKHKLLGGVEFGRQQTDNLRNVGRFNGATATTATLANPRFGGVLTFVPSVNNRSVSDVASVYVQDQIEFSPQWLAVVGLRYDRFSVDFTNRTDAKNNTSQTDTPVSPRVGLVYKPVQAVSIYGSYSIAYVPRAGEQLTSLTPGNKVFDPEEFKNIELGAKWDIRPDLSATAAIYKLDRSNVVVAGATAGTNFLVDGQTSKGVELGLSGKICQAWSVMGGYAYQDAKLATNAAFASLNGATLAMVPKQTVSLWNRYDLNPQWAAALGVVYRDSIYSAVSNTVSLPSFTRIDGAVYYKLNQNYQLQANVENLFDKKYYASAHNNNNITPGSPRALKVTLNAKF